VNSSQQQNIQPESKITSLSGLHILANLGCSQTDLLNDFKPTQALFESLIERFNLQKVGEVYHNFQCGGFTAVICLTESHLSIHTWPEHNYFTFDIFLSNYMKDNSHTTKEFYQCVVDFFSATVLDEKFVNR
jgi:S-adenosylmethionine decarboxylase